MLTSSFLGSWALSLCFSLKSCLHSGLGPEVKEALWLPIVRAGGTNKGLPPWDCGMFIILTKSICLVSQEIPSSYLRTGPKISSHQPLLQGSTGPLEDKPVGTQRETKVGSKPTLTVFMRLKWPWKQTRNWCVPQFLPYSFLSTLSREQGVTHTARAEKQRS